MFLAILDYPSSDTWFVRELKLKFHTEFATYKPYSIRTAFWFEKIDIDPNLLHLTLLQKSRPYNRPNNKRSVIKK